MRRSRLTPLTLILALAGTLAAGGCDRSTEQQLPTPFTLTTAQITAAFQQPCPDGQGRTWEAVAGEGGELDSLWELYRDGRPSSPPPGQPEQTPLLMLQHHATELAGDGINQLGQVYPDPAAAQAAMRTLQDQALACPSSSTVPRRLLPDDAYIPITAMTFSTRVATVGAWTGFTADGTSRALEGDLRGVSSWSRTFLGRGNTLLIIDLYSFRDAEGDETPGPYDWEPAWRAQAVPILARLDATAAS